jgi:hypothetical protein
MQHDLMIRQNHPLCLPCSQRFYGMMGRLDEARMELAKAQLAIPGLNSNRSRSAGRGGTSR